MLDWVVAFDIKSGTIYSALHNQDRCSSGMQMRNSLSQGGGMADAQGFLFVWQEHIREGGGRACGGGESDVVQGAGRAKEIICDILGSNGIQRAQVGEDGTVIALAQG